MTPLTPNQPSPKQQGQNQSLDVSPVKQDCPTLFNFLDQFQGNHDPKDHKLELHYGGSSSTNHQQFYNSSSNSAMVDQSIVRRHTNLPSSTEVEDSGKRNDKWVSSKARLMKMLMIPERSYGDMNEDKAIITATASAAATIPSNEGIQNERYNQGSPTARACAECQTTSTPLWRSGPVGPKTLCNACGIRQRKARRAAKEAENSLATSTKIIGHNKEKEEKLLVNKCTQFKKNKTSSTSTSTASATMTTNDSSLSEEMMERLDFFLTKVRKKSGFESTTEEVADTALLLMDISCGYVYP
ncbi:putative GATA transcription factor 22 [Vicia villosa]|uniref:putative GATA transcription factor 22 n=1 Tax=Vicia villosa TaxID=3911 RepID=UPI00273BCC2C|nr:putative GATA transcription factor 22 [Vicia villosa]